MRKYSKKALQMIHQYREQGLNFKEITKRINKMFKRQSSVGAIRDAHRRYVKKIEENNGQEFKTLFLDIETSPNIVLAWRCGTKINVGFENIIKERAIICISYKWKGDKEVHTVTWDENQCDKKLLKKISKVILQADEIVAHNGDRFDIRWINGRLAFHNLPPLGPLTTTDTLKLSRQVFTLNSQKLNYLGQFFKVGQKVETGGFQLWKSICLDKCIKSLKKMVKYCEQDVRLLEKVFDKVIRYNPKLHRGHAMKGDKAVCRNCGSHHTKKHGLYYTAAGFKYQRYFCHDCQTAFRSTTRLKKEVINE